MRKRKKRITRALTCCRSFGGSQPHFECVGKMISPDRRIPTLEISTTNQDHHLPTNCSSLPPYSKSRGCNLSTTGLSALQTRGFPGTMCNNHWVMFQCSCAPKLRETAPCPALQIRPLGRCTGVRDTAHDIPFACNGCRRRLKREGIPIDRAKWLDKMLPKVFEDMVEIDSKEELVVGLGIEMS